MVRHDNSSILAPSVTAIHCPTTTPCLIKKEPEPNTAYFDNHKLKLHKNRSKHARIIVHCDYEISTVGFLTALCQSL